MQSVNREKKTIKKRIMKEEKYDTKFKEEKSQNCCDS
jgi:hypothetical protein